MEELAGKILEAFQRMATTFEFDLVYESFVNLYQ